MSITNDRYEPRGACCAVCTRPLGDPDGWTYCDDCSAWTCGDCPAHEDAR